MTAHGVEGQLALPLPDPGHDAKLAARITPGWQTQAACTSMPGDAFYPDPDDHGAQIEAAAVTTCNGCRVRSSCRAAALLNSEQGIWGGTNDVDRDRMRAALSAGVSVDAVLIETIRPRSEETAA